MPQTLQVDVHQIGPTTSEGRARDHRVKIDRPVAKGGSDAGPLGGELLLLALGGCFMSTLLAAIRAREAAVSNVRITVEATLDNDPDRFTAMTLTVRADHDDADLVRKLIAMSEKACIVTNTLRQGIPVSAVLAE